MNYEIVMNRPVLVLHKQGQLTDVCPFCKTSHIHGTLEGHRVGHCAINKPVIIKATDGTELSSEYGYVLRNFESLNQFDSIHYGFYLSNRSRGVLIYHRILKISQILQLTEKQLRELKGVGEVTFNNIMGFIELLGFSLKKSENQG